MLRIHTPIEPLPAERWVEASDALHQLSHVLADWGVALEGNPKCRRHLKRAAWELQKAQQRLHKSKVEAH